MKRKALEHLKQWKNEKRRKPLVIRGARQVGKTWLVREFGKMTFKSVLEINFDRNPEMADLMMLPDLKEVLRNLELTLDTDIQVGTTLLFLDEIQSAPQVFSRLRYFYEELPELHVIAAGSLLEFLLEDHEFSMPVGRIEYLFLGPLTFEEFLLGIGEKRLVTFLKEYKFGVNIPENLHQKLLNFVKSYFIVGGMPAVISAYLQKNSYRDAIREQQIVLETYEDDFNKYKRKVNTNRIKKVFKKIPTMIGQKIKYVNIDRHEKSAALSQAIYLLEQARIIYCVKHTAANGLPLEAEINERDFKTIFLDIGLIQSSLNLQYSEILQSNELISINSGSLAEQYVGQHLLSLSPHHQKPSLQYWNRENKSSTAEIDYLKVIGGKIVPIEVKARKTGSLKSLHLFVSTKQVAQAIKYSSAKPQRSDLNAMAFNKQGHAFTLLSIPFYLIEQSERLIG